MHYKDFIVTDNLGPSDHYHNNNNTTPNRKPNYAETHSSDESVGSVTPPQKINVLTHDYQSQQHENKPLNQGNLPYNQQWVLDPLNLDRQTESDIAKSMELYSNVSGIDLSVRRDVRMLSSETGSTYCEIVDIAHQKLDFSMLCQQASSSIYVMGGFIEDSQCFVEKYDIQKEKWEVAGTFNNNRTKFSSLVLPNSKSILILGGKQVLKSFYKPLISKGRGPHSDLYGVLSD